MKTPIPHPEIKPLVAKLRAGGFMPIGQEAAFYKTIEDCLSNLVGSVSATTFYNQALGAVRVRFNDGSKGVPIARFQEGLWLDAHYEYFCDPPAVADGWQVFDDVLLHPADVIDSFDITPDIFKRSTGVGV